MGARFLGLDVAWSPKNPTGAAVIDEAGTVLDVRADLGDDADVLAWVRQHLGPCGIIGFDMPTIVRNATGTRPCERELARDFRAYDAGPHPANLGRPLFADGGRAARMIAALAADGVRETLDIAPRDPRRLALEVFPHPAHVRLFDLPRVFKYKKKPGRESFLTEWQRYRAALATLALAEPPLVLDERIPASVGAAGYKRWDDTLDALTCAYIASWVWHWGNVAEHVTVYGDTESGYIVVPAHAAILHAGLSTRIGGNVC